MMHDEKEMNKHLGESIRYRDKYKALKPVEIYFRQQCVKRGIELSFDCTAKEPPYFKTLNYTTYAGLFVMHPLSFEESLFQMFNAKADSLPSRGHLDLVKENFGDKYNNSNKYQPVEDVFEDIIILPGSNKFYKHVSQAKYENLCIEKGEKLLIKPHPITQKEVIRNVKEYSYGATVADQNHPLEPLLKSAKAAESDAPGFVIKTNYIKPRGHDALLIF